MARNFWSFVNKIINDCDVVLMVLDARIPELTINTEIERKIERAGKKLIYVINKCDLIDMDTAKQIKQKIPHSVFVSSMRHYGGTILKKKIMQFASRREQEIKPRLEAGELVRKSLTVAVVGYPNTGKSSVINMLAGKSKASTSSFAGHTKGVQKVRINPRVMLIDSPGVIPFERKGDIKQVILGSLNPNSIKDIDLHAMELVTHLNKQVQYHYFEEFDEDLDEEAVIEKIAQKLNYKKKGNEFDIIKASSKLILDWQRGKINIKLNENLDELESINSDD